MSRLETILERPWRALAVLIPLSLLLAAPTLRVRFGGTLLDLLPDRPVARAFARAIATVSGDDIDLVLLEGDSPSAVRTAGDLLADDLARRPSVAASMGRVPITADPSPSALFQALVSRGDEATMTALAQRFGPGGADAAAARVFTMAMAPGAGAMRQLLTSDPYDLAPLLGARLSHLGAGVRPSADGAIVSPDGRARLIVLRGRRSAYDLTFSDAMATDLNRGFAQVSARVPGVRMRWTGPHAISLAVRDLIRSDLVRSSILASILVSAIFLLAMRRVRALIGVGIPLLIGTAWTTALAAVAIKGLNAISIAFGAIVLGVGMDTGVHLYDRVLTERRGGMSASHAAARALRELGWPVMTAAITAAAAFGSLCFSELRALRELGLLAAAGEVLTAIAIILLTPALAAALEPLSVVVNIREPRGIRVSIHEPRADAPSPKPGFELVSGSPPTIAGSDRMWPRAAGAIAGSRYTPPIVMAAMAALAAVTAFGHRPRLADVVVLVRPHALVPLQVQHDIFERFGGEPGQWMIVGEAPDMERALQVSEGIERALLPLEQRGVLAGFDSVAALAPSLAAQTAHRNAVTALQPALAAVRLATALAARGARVEMFEPGLAALRAPLPEPRAIDPLTGPAAALARRFIARHEGRVVFLAYARPRPHQVLDTVRTAVASAVHAVDPTLVLTGAPLLEADVRAALQSDTWRVGGLAGLLVTLLLFLALRSPKRVALAMAGVGIEIVALFAFLGIANIKLDAYNLLAVPVLVGITIDEIVFVLHAFDEASGTPAERARSAVRGMTSATTATAAATAAGFLALASCKFEALRGLGIVAGVGTMLGLVCAIIVVPAFARLTAGAEHPKHAPPGSRNPDTNT